MSNAKRKPNTDFVLMGRTRALLADLWQQWKDDIDQTPDVAKRAMTAAINELHQAEKKMSKKANTKKSAAKRAVKKTVKKAAKKMGMKKARSKKKI